MSVALDRPHMLANQVDKDTRCRQQSSLTLVHDGKLPEDLLLPRNIENRQSASRDIRRYLATMSQSDCMACSDDFEHASARRNRDRRHDTAAHRVNRCARVK